MSKNLEVRDREKLAFHSAGRHRELRFLRLLASTCLKVKKAFVTLRSSQYRDGQHYRIQIYISPNLQLLPSYISVTLK